MSVGVDVSRPRLTGAPERIFVSVDETTGRSTVSFAPADVGAPFQHADDRTGELALRDARAIADAHPGSIVVGPHFHASRPDGPKPRRRR